MTETYDSTVLRKLSALQTHLESIKISAKVIEKNEELEMTTLLVSAEGDYLDRTQFVNIAYLPDFEEGESFLDLIQYFTELELPVSEQQVPLAEKMLNFINVRMPIGHFSTENNKVYYRYVLADLKDHPDQGEKIIATFFMFIDVLDLFQQSIEEILAGKQSLEAFMSRF